jgi:broad specificity phosphatase PhoE
MIGTGTPRKMLLVRHGETNENKAIRFQGHSGGPLNATGRQQAEACKNRLSALAIVGCMSSDLVRAAETAEIICTGLPGLVPQQDARLREVDVGAWAGLNRDALLRAFPEEYRSWAAGVDVQRGGGETYANVADRMVETLVEFDHRSPPGLLLVVSHGGAIRATLARLIGCPQSHLTSIRNTAASLIDFYPNAVDAGVTQPDAPGASNSPFGVLLVFNDVQHLRSDPLLTE